MMNYFFAENKINELCNSDTNPKIKDEFLLYKNYLNNKRKRSYSKLKEGIQSIEKSKKKMKKDNEDDKQKEKSIIEKNKNSIKLQNFSKNIFSLIFAYLRVDDLLKLKDIGSHSIRLYISELLCLMKNDNILTLREINSRSNLYLNCSDSINCKKYYLMNNGKNIQINNSIKIKYTLYNKKTNKNYCLIHYKLKYFFCDSINDDTSINLGKDILFVLPDKNFYEKFQFIEGFNNLEVAIFSLYKILLYNLVTGLKDHCISLRRPCDFVLYKKELKLLIVSHFPDEIEFFKIYCGKSNIKESKHIFKTEEDAFQNKELPIILNFNDYINNDNYESYICIYYRKSKKIFIFDCKLFKLVETIITDYNIDRINITNKYLISITNTTINYYSINDKFSFLNCFDLKDISITSNIKYISSLDSKYFENLFLIIVQNPSKKIYKPILLFLENNGINNFYYSLGSLKNEITDHIYDDEMICISCSEEKINHKNKIKMKMLICHLKIENRSDCYLKEYNISL